jgi:hypothetical protein
MHMCKENFKKKILFQYIPIEAREKLTQVPFLFNYSQSRLIMFL